MSDNWDFYFVNLNDKLASIFVDLGKHSSAPDSAIPWLLWVRVYLNHAHKNGLTTPGEAEVLYEIGDILSQAVCATTKGMMVGRATTDGHREFYFYSETCDHIEEIVTDSMVAFPDYRWEVGSKHDPEWNHYLESLYPSPRDWQRIKNRNMVEQLREHGDALTKERPVFHWAYFSDDEARSQFVSTIEEWGFLVTDQNEAKRRDGARALSVQFNRSDYVDWDSINQVTLELFELTRSLAGDYDGWETSIEKHNE